MNPYCFDSSNAESIFRISNIISYQSQNEFSNFLNSSFYSCEYFIMNGVSICC